MGTYKGIQGFMVENLASDPGTLSEVVGKLWYNSGSNVWKVCKESTAAWASGTNVPVATTRAVGFGSTTGAMFATGQLVPLADTSESYIFNGTAWTDVANVNLARRGAAGMGASSTSGIIAGGLTTPAAHVVKTEIWNGESWAEAADLNTGRSGNNGAGIVTAAITFGGEGTPNPPTGLDQTEIYNGTSWTDVNTLNQGRMEFGSANAGTTTATLCIGGTPPQFYDLTEEWNGTAWTEVNDINTARANLVGAGTVTSCIVYAGKTRPGGTVTPMALTESWNGTSWTEVADLATARKDPCQSNGTSTAALALAGDDLPAPGTNIVNVEEWSDPVYAAATVTTS